MLAGHHDRVQGLGRRGGSGQSGVDGADPPDLVAPVVEAVDLHEAVLLPRQVNGRHRRVSLGGSKPREAEQDLLSAAVGDATCAVGGQPALAGDTRSRHGLGRRFGGPLTEGLHEQCLGVPQ